MAMTTLNPTPRLAVLGLWMHVVLGDEYCSSVVERALNSRKQVSNEGRQGLASAIDAAVKGIPQFPKRPSIAPPAFLVEPVMHEMIHSDRLVGAVVESLGRVPTGASRPGSRASRRDRDGGGIPGLLR